MSYPRQRDLHSGRYESLKSHDIHIFSPTSLEHGAEPIMRIQLSPQSVKKFPASCGTRWFITEVEAEAVVGQNPVSLQSTLSQHSGQIHSIPASSSGGPVRN